MLEGRVRHRDRVEPGVQVGAVHVAHHGVGQLDPLRVRGLDAAPVVGGGGGGAAVAVGVAADAVVQDGGEGDRAGGGS